MRVHASTHSVIHLWNVHLQVLSFLSHSVGLRLGILLGIHVFPEFLSLLLRGCILIVASLATLEDVLELWLLLLKVLKMMMHLLLVLKGLEGRHLVRGLVELALHVGVGVHLLLGLLLQGVCCHLLLANHDSLVGIVDSRHVDDLCLELVGCIAILSLVLARVLPSS